jgi:ornithine--oxo-acid transaminase
MNAVVIDHPDPEAAWKLCITMMQQGLLAKPTHGDKIRFAPPLVITADQIDEALKIIENSLSILD